MLAPCLPIPNLTPYVSVCSVWSQPLLLPHFLLLSRSRSRVLVWLLEVHGASKRLLREGVASPGQQPEPQKPCFGLQFWPQQPWFQHQFWPQQPWFRPQFWPQQPWFQHQFWPQQPWFRPQQPWFRLQNRPTKPWIRAPVLAHTAMLPCSITWLTQPGSRLLFRTQQPWSRLQFRLQY
ncbi:B3-hordein-like [Notothenia coriiceps]|uniref:B3-hordein-like n=1 Tax=Notothenia coriiceps TaxID=8208 RepID=A0A6I9MQZ2_9TELE|nr:PREDICTED: B3-hordein-like [Notothenia coriiceps]